MTSRFLLSFQALVTRYPSISSRKLSSALTVLTSNKCMVAMSDYNDFHKTVKKLILTNVLGANAQVGYTNFVITWMFENAKFFYMWLLKKWWFIFVIVFVPRFLEATSLQQRSHDRQHAKAFESTYKDLSKSSCKFQGYICAWTFWVCSKTCKFSFIINTVLCIE